MAMNHDLLPVMKRMRRMHMYHPHDERQKHHREKGPKVIAWSILSSLWNLSVLGPGLYYASGLRLSCWDRCQPSGSGRAE